MSLFKGLAKGLSLRTKNNSTLIRYTFDGNPSIIQIQNFQMCYIFSFVIKREI